MNWLNLPNSGELIVISIGLVFWLATFWEWRKGYFPVKGHFVVPSIWKGSLLFRFIGASMFILTPFFTTDSQTLINRQKVQSMGVALLILVGIVTVISGLIGERRKQRF